jgi:general secretion pathway protein A
MYQGYFGLKNAPFSIVPDHRVMYMSDSHREAVAHLLYSLEQSGGFVQLTGEVGTGKTTVSRYILQHLPENVDVALLLNPRVNELELLESVCDELKISYPENASLKSLIAALNSYLLESHSSGRHTVLIIDEAQNLDREVLEQIRLLTNLETSSDKLLQIILIGQPELVHILQRHDLRQLSQRIVGRFMLTPLNVEETREYIAYRLAQAGCERTLFSRLASRRIHKLSGGIPRLINVLCDSALMRAYSSNRDKVTYRTVNYVAREIFLQQKGRSVMGKILRFLLLLLLLLGLVWGYFFVTGNQQISQMISGIWSNLNQDQIEDVALQIPASTNPSDPVDSPSTVVAQAENNVSISPASAPKTATVGQNDNAGKRFDLGYRLGVPLDNN